MKNYRAKTAATDRVFHSIELSDTQAAEIGGGMSVSVSASSDTSEAISTGMASAMSGSGLNIVANNSLGSGKSLTLSLQNEPTIAADVAISDLSIGRFDFRNLDLKNPKLKSAFDRFLACYR